MKDTYKQQQRPDVVEGSGSFWPPVNWGELPNTVQPVLSGPVLNGHPLLSGQL